jgi:hypothetical protein
VTVRYENFANEIRELEYGRSPKAVLGWKSAVTGTVA